MLSTDQERTDMHCPSVITDNERKYVPIQTISPVALAGSDVQKRRIELNFGSVNQQSLCKETEGNCCKKEGKKEKEQELRKSGRQVCKMLPLCSEDIV
jgi:hypothetical protein